VANNVSIFCKSYRGDLVAAITMVVSVDRYNRDTLPLYIAVPQDDLNLFKSTIDSKNVIWLTDEEIIGANPSVDLAAFHDLLGTISQQIVKAEFWRLNPHDNCVCIDSDSRFIRDFYASDFLSSEGHPYTVLHEAKPFREFCLVHNIQETELHFEAISKEMRNYFNRQGPSYGFNPFPVIWSNKVWSVLSDHLTETDSNILEAIVAHPYESSWYAEVLLKYRPIPLLPIEPLFKAYLYLEEYEYDQRVGMDETKLAYFYLGVVYQSNWYPRRLKLAKRWAYKLKRYFQRYKNRSD